MISGENITYNNTNKIKLIVINKNGVPVLNGLVIHVDNINLEVESRTELHLDDIDNIIKIVVNSINITYRLLESLRNNNVALSSENSNRIAKNTMSENVSNSNKVHHNNIREGNSISECANRLLIYYNKESGETFKIITANKVINNIKRYDHLERYLKEMGFNADYIREINIKINEKLRELRRKSNFTEAELCLGNPHNSVKNFLKSNSKLQSRVHLVALNECLKYTVFKELAAGTRKKCVEHIGKKKVLFVSKLFNIDKETINEDIGAIVYVGKRQGKLFEVIIENPSNHSEPSIVFQQSEKTPLNEFINNIMHYLNNTISSHKDSNNVKESINYMHMKNDLTKYTNYKSQNTTKYSKGIMPICPRCGAKMWLDLFAGQPRTFEGYTRPRYICKNCGYVMQA